LKLNTFGIRLDGPSIGFNPIIDPSGNNYKGIEMVEVAPGKYEFKFYHLEGTGYGIVLTDGIDTLVYQSSCSSVKENYDTSINKVCAYSAPITLQTSFPTGTVTYYFLQNSAFAFTSGFDENTLINAAIANGPITQLDPSNYTPGDTISLYMKWTPFGAGGLGTGLCPKTLVINIVIDASSPNCLASVGDYVWRDDNKNGAQDANEAGVSGIPVTLYNSNGVSVGTTVTDAYGKYLFTDLTPGNYSVGFTAPINYGFTTTTGTSKTNPTNNDVNPITGQTSTFLLAGGENNRNIDAGIVYLPLAPTATVGDRVWYDANSNGTQDVGEVGMSNVVVNLVDASGVIVNTSVTDADGKYLFSDVKPNTYTVRFTPPMGSIFTSNNGVLSSTNNSDVNTSGETAPFNVIAGDAIRYVDAGIILQSPLKASLGDKVWNDFNANGSQDANEPGIANVVVNLYDAAGITIIGTATTDAMGNYSFNNLDSGAYVVGFVLPSGFTFTTPLAAGVDVAANSDANSTTGKTVPVVIKQSERNSTIDAGLIASTPAGTLLLGDKVWYDNNSNGVQDPTEIGASGVTVVLFTNGADGLAGTSDDVLKATTVTDKAGNYLFGYLAASTNTTNQYNVLFKNIPENYTFTTPLQTANAATTSTDSDPIVSSGRTASINLTANNLTIDAGLIQGLPAGKASLGDKVFVDLNADGIQDANEPGVSDVIVKLYKDANNDGLINGAEATPIATTTTNALGNYIFNNLDAGNYQLGFNGLPAAYTVTAADQTANDEKDSDGKPINTSVAGNTAVAGQSLTPLVSLANGQDNMSVDLGLVPPANTNTLGNFVWLDVNNNGLQNTNEPGVKGVMVSLLNATGTVLDNTVTDENGKYLFTGLPDGNYSVQFSNLPSGFTFTNQSATNTANGSDANTTTGKTVAVILNASNRNDSTLDAGLFSTRAGLGNYVWFDDNSNGLQDANEMPVIGATATLFSPEGADGIAGNADDANPIASSITDASGSYYFGNLNAGNYQVAFTTLPTGYTFTKQVNAGDNQNNTNSDANIVTGKSVVIALELSEFDLTIDAGIAPKATATVGDFVWMDNNKNGLQNVNEPGVAGVLVTLFNSANQAVGSSITDGNGAYLISKVPADAGYYVKFSTNINGFNTAGKPTFVIPNQGANGAGTGAAAESNLDSDAGNIAGATFGNTGIFTVMNGDNIKNVDAGIFLPITLSGNVWHDINGNNDGFVNNSGAATVPAAAPIPVGLIAYLVNPTTNVIEKRAFVNATTGVYNVGEIKASTNYYVLLSSVSSPIGSIVPANFLPPGWENTGEKLGITVGNDGVINGRLNVPGSINNIINANFGIRLKNGEAVIP
jgi:SdrD B-like domain